MGPSPHEFGNNFSFVGSSKYWRGQFCINSWTCISLDDARVVFWWDRDIVFRRPSGPKLMTGKEPSKCRRFQRLTSLCPASKAVIYARDPPAGPARYQATYFFSQLILTVPLSRLLLATRALLGDDRLVDGAELRQRLFFDRWKVPWSYLEGPSKIDDCPQSIRLVLLGCPHPTGGLLVGFYSRLALWGGTHGAPSNQREIIGKPTE